ncbi:dentin sialophosphoprotein-like [Dermacentor albipictus]|uniref:dentin sialophosphoprotein-like n=1 Tax=Dermacentor albipictus TaxID=60249 RepID=UPI0038FD3BEA
MYPPSSQHAQHSPTIYTGHPVVIPPSTHYTHHSPSPPTIETSHPATEKIREIENVDKSVSLHRRVLLEQLLNKWAWLDDSDSSSSSDDEDSDGGDGGHPVLVVLACGGKHGRNDCDSQDKHSSKDNSRNEEGVLPNFADGEPGPSKRPRMDEEECCDCNLGPSGDQESYTLSQLEDEHDSYRMKVAPFPDWLDSDGGATEKIREIENVDKSVSLHRRVLLEQLLNKWAWLDDSDSSSSSDDEDSDGGDGGPPVLVVLACGGKRGRDDCDSQDKNSSKENSRDEEGVLRNFGDEDPGPSKHPRVDEEECCDCSPGPSGDQENYTSPQLEDEHDSYRMKVAPFPDWLDSDGGATEKIREIENGEKSVNLHRRVLLEQLLNKWAWLDDSDSSSSSDDGDSDDGDGGPPVPVVPGSGVKRGRDDCDGEDKDSSKQNSGDQEGVLANFDDGEPGPCKRRRVDEEECWDCRPGPSGDQENYTSPQLEDENDSYRMKVAPFPDWLDSDGGATEKIREIENGEKSVSLHRRVLLEQLLNKWAWLDDSDSSSSSDDEDSDDGDGGPPVPVVPGSGVKRGRDDCDGEDKDSSKQNSGYQEGVLANFDDGEPGPSKRRRVDEEECWDCRPGPSGYQENYTSPQLEDENDSYRMKVAPFPDWLDSEGGATEKIREIEKSVSLHRRVLLEQLLNKWAWLDDSDSSSSSDDEDSDDGVGGPPVPVVPASGVKHGRDDCDGEDKDSSKQNSGYQEGVLANFDDGEPGPSKRRRVDEQECWDCRPGPSGYQENYTSPQLEGENDSYRMKVAPFPDWLDSDGGVCEEPVQEPDLSFLDI